MRSEGGVLIPEGDEIRAVRKDGFTVEGRVLTRLIGPDGRLKQSQIQHNIITQVGRQYLTKRAANITTLPLQVSGAKLGQGTTAEAVTGAGAALVTYITGSQKAIDGGYPTEAAQGNGSRVTWQITWGAGVATNSNINEVVLVNEASLTDATTTAPSTVSRAVIAVVNKAAGDTLVVTWQWDIGVT